MKRSNIFKLVAFLALFSLISLQAFSVDLHTFGPTGSHLISDDYGIVSHFSVGMGDNELNWWDHYTAFVELNGGPPLEVCELNAEIWDGLNPPAPIGGGFFHPGRYEDYSFDPLSPNVWSTILKYEDIPNNILLMGGRGHKLLDPSPILGIPYVEYRPCYQFTNMGAADLTIKPFIYLRTYPVMQWAYYSNHAPWPFTNWFADYDGVDGTSDDFVTIMQVDNWFNHKYAYAWTGLDPEGYRIQARVVPGLYEEILAGAPGYSLVNSFAPVGAGASETAFEFDTYTLAPEEALLVWIMPKAIKVNNNTLTNIDYDQENIVLGVMPHEFTDTDVTINFNDITFVQNPLSWFPNVHSTVTVVELTGGIVESGIADDLVNVSTIRYWEIFSDTRCNTHNADITFSYDPDIDGIEDEADLLLAFRADYDDDWEEYPNIVIDEVNNTITALGVEDFGQWVFGSSGNNAFAPAVGQVQFMTFLTLPAAPPLIPNPVDTFDVSDWINEGETWTIQPISVIGTPWADLQDMMDGLTGMSVDIPIGFTQEYQFAKVWVELHINQNTQYTPGFPFGTHVWLDNMYFEPMAGFPDDALWINADFNSYLYTEVDDSVSYGTPENPFSAPLYVTYDPDNIQPFVETLPGYDPANGTFFNFQSQQGAVTSVGIVPDPILDWAYNVWHFTPFIGGMNNGNLTQTTIATATAAAGDESAYLTWMTQTEYNSDYFNVYRDGVVIGTVPAAGVSADPIDYDYLDEGLIGGQEYEYEISVVMLDGAEIFYPETFQVTSSSTTTYTTLVTIAVDGEDVVLTWAEIPGMYSYTIYRSEDPYFIVSPELQYDIVYDTTYRDEGALTAGSQFYYKVVGTMSD